MSKGTNKHRVQAGKTYKVSFGVIQTQKINKAANAVDETPQAFLKTATADKAKAITGE